MGRQKERTEIDFCLRAHEMSPLETDLFVDQGSVDLEGFNGTYTVGARPIDIKATIDAHFDGNDDCEPAGLPNEVHAIFEEEQSRIFPDRTLWRNTNLRYQLLDSAYQQGNLFLHPEAVEDPYDEESWA